MSQADFNDGDSTDDNSIGGKSILLERLDFKAPVFESVIRNRRISIIGAGAFGERTGELLKSHVLMTSSRDCHSHSGCPCRTPCDSVRQESRGGEQYQRGARQP